MLDNNKTTEMVNALVDFVIRVANKENATPAELEALPRVANVVLDH